MTRKVWIQDRVTGRLVPQEEWRAERSGARVIAVVPDIGDFSNPQGIVLNGRKALREDLARQNCHVYERGERQHIEAMKAQAERDDQRSLRRTIGEIAAERGLGRAD